MTDINKTTGKDVAYSLFKGVVGTIPGAGSIAAEAFGLLVSSPIEKRRAAWMEEVGEKLLELEEKGAINLVELRENEEFIDIVIQATTFALKTSRQEKRQAFKNAIINTAIGEAPEASKAAIFLNYLDKFTVWHIEILCFINNPRDWYAKHSKQEPSMMMGSLSGVLTDAFPELKTNKELLGLIWSDLEGACLHRSGDINTMMSGDGVLANRSTPLGQEFIEFISNN